jgi:tricorn protease
MTTLSRCLVALLLGVFLSMPASAQEPIRFGRTPDIAPDGRQIAFSYLGDIWTVEAIGGVARLVTTHEAHDIMPVFSPDGRHLAFSSNRHGSYDVFVVPVHGGKPRRLTFDSASDLVSGWSPDGKTVLFASNRGTDFPPVTELYTVPVGGGREQRVTPFEGRDGVFSPRGDRIAYVRGAGSAARKGYRGSANNDLWVCKADGTDNRQLTSFNGQDGTPMWSADGKTLFYVSEQFGAANICKVPADGNGNPEQVTRHLEDSVRRARVSANGEWMVYECGADIWVCAVNGELRCRKVAIEAYADDRVNPEETVTFTQGITEYSLAPDEQHIAFVVRGEIFVMPLKGGKARRLTYHPGHDREPVWAPDKKKLIFLSDRGGEDNIYALELGDLTKPTPAAEQETNVTRLTKVSTPESDISFSPDGRRVTFLRDGKLWTMKPDGSEQKALVEQPRVIEYEWSPDSKWVVYARMDAAFASELYLIPAAGGEARNITRYATRNFGLSWAGDGRKLAFISQRRQDLDVFVLALQKPAREGETPKAGEIDLEDIHHRVTRVTSLGGDESEAALRPDGTQVAFRSDALNSDDLWLASSNGSQITRLTTGNQRPQQIRWTRMGAVMYLDGSGALRLVRPSLSSLPGLNEVGPARISFSAKMKIDRGEEFAQMFEECWSKLQHQFYDPKLSGTDWVALRMRYRPLVKHVCMHEDFYDLVSLLLGELNASHLGIGGKTRAPEEQTAELGLLWDESYRGPGLKIGEVLKRGPADRRGVSLQAGEYVMAVNGKELTEAVNLSELLNEKAGEMVSLQVAADPTETSRRTVLLQPVSRTAVSDLVYERWVAHNAKRVHELSSGKLGYIHIRAMNNAGLDEFVRQLYSEHYDKEAIVLDVRYNTGGSTHDKVLSYLGGKDHTFFITREGAKGTVLRADDRKWTRPVVVLCNNRSYSDAEIFASAFRNLGLGKLVGLPTYGYVIGTINEQLIDGSLFRIPRLGVYTAGGVNMDKEGVVPDVVVDLHPDQVAKGEDAQLAKAVEVLQSDVEVWKKTQKPAVAVVIPPEPTKTPITAPGGDK